jgi:HEAT repeat protein
MDKNVIFKGNGADSAIAAAGSPAGSANVEALIRTIRNSQDSAVLKSAIVAIVELRDPRFIEPLIGTLKSNNNNARRLATWALGALGDARSRDALKAALTDPDEIVRNMARDALKRMDGNAPSPVPSQEKKPSQSHLDMVLGTLRNDAEAFNRQAAARALGDIRDPRALEGLLEGMKDSDPIVRSAAALAMVGFKKDPRVFETLVAGLKDDDFAVRGDSALALGRIEDDRAFDPLLNALLNGRPELREKAATALGEMGDLRAIDGLRGSMMRDEMTEVRRSAKEALTVMARQVSKGLKDADPDVREMTADQLGKILDPYPVPFLIEALSDEEPVVRENAAMALGLIGDRSATLPLINLLKDGRGYVRKHAAHALGVLKDPRAVDALLAAARDEQWFVRADVAWALGQIGSEKALKVLMAMFNDQNRTVRQTAVEAVQRFKNCKVSFKPLTRRE